MNTLPLPGFTKLMIAVEIARRAAVRGNDPRVVRSISRDADVVRIVEWITAERARDRSLPEARHEAEQALILAIETTCDIDVDYEKTGCEDCGHPRAGPMLLDAVWATIAAKTTRLCFGCIEKRLGRKLTTADLTGCVFNAGWIAFDPADAAARQFAIGRHFIEGAAAPEPAEPSAADGLDIPPVLRRARTAGAAP
jgi:hypothetical protein